MTMENAQLRKGLRKYERYTEKIATQISHHIGEGGRAST